MNTFSRISLFCLMMVFSLCTRAKTNPDLPKRQVQIPEPKISLVYPQQGIQEVPPVVTLEWTSSDSLAGQLFRVQLFDQSGEMTLDQVVHQNWTQVRGLEKGSLYHWRIRSEETSGNSSWSEFGSFVSSSLDTLLFVEDASPGVSLDGRIPVLMIHGWNPNGKPSKPTGGMWTNIRNYIQNDPDLSAGFKPYLVKYWSNAVSVAELAAQLPKALEEAGLSNRKVIILAHSMGGLVSRSFMNEQTITSGPYSGQTCGNQVKLLLTLGSPHHGSPMANGPARDDKVSFLNRIYMAIVEAFVFDEMKYNEVNRGDMRWDNYDNLYNYNKYPDEKNDWLVNLNSLNTFDQRTVCYSATIPGKFYLSPEGTEQSYQMGAYLQKTTLGFNNDGIVPYQSSSFEGHNVKTVRYFPGYNHSDINTGKPEDSSLFDSLKTDLLPFLPLLVLQPDQQKLWLKGGSTYNIRWRSPEDIQTVDIFYSADNGKSYNTVVENFNSADGSYFWTVPTINSDSCLIRIINSADPNEEAFSSGWFSIYHNTLEVKSPSSEHYVVWKRSQEIEWSQTGLGQFVDLVYLDEKNKIEKTIAYDLSFSAGNNSWAWPVDTTFMPTDSARLRFELKGMNETYGDTTTYSWYSDYFTLFGDPRLTLSFRSDTLPDEFGITGLKLEIDSTYQAEWHSEGEIGCLQLFLCDSLKNKISRLYKKIKMPEFTSAGSSDWTAPEVHGDRFWLLLEGGPDSSTVTTSVFNSHAFRINRYPRIIVPGESNPTLPLLPCFEFLVSGKEDQLKIDLKDENNSISTYYSEQQKICIPSGLNHELIPGRSYLATGWELYGTDQSYPLSRSFRTQADPPSVFSIVSPDRGQILNDSMVTVIWNHSTGASSYQLEIIHRGDTLVSTANLSRSDTLVLADLGDWWHKDSIFIQVTAFNEFGMQMSESFFFNTFKADTPHFEYDPVSLFQLHNYPNPMELGTTFQFTLPENRSDRHVVLSLYNLSGQNLLPIVDQDLNSGTHLVEWNIQSGLSQRIGPGIYVVQLISDGQSEAIRISVK